MRGSMLAMLACLAALALADPAAAQRGGAVQSPIFGGRQHGPAALGRVPESEQRTSKEEQERFEALYRDVMARSERPHNDIDAYAVLPNEPAPKR